MVMEEVLMTQRTEDGSGRAPSPAGRASTSRVDFLSADVRMIVNELKESKNAAIN